MGEDSGEEMLVPERQAKAAAPVVRACGVAVLVTEDAKTIGGDEQSRN